MRPTSVRKLLSPLRLLGAGLFLLLVTAAVLWLIPSSEYLLLPDTARPVAPLVSVKGGRDPKGPGGIYFDAVIVRRAKLFEQLFPWIHDGATLVPADLVNPPGVSDTQRRREDLREMARSQDIAAAVALEVPRLQGDADPDRRADRGRRAGSPAAKAGLEPTDVIVGIDGKPVRTSAELRQLISRHRPGESGRLRSGRKGLRKVRAGRSRGRTAAPLIGVVVQQATQVKLPFPVRIDAGSIGGPSAGLAFALDVLEELGRDVDHGYKVAATGELDPDGTVVPIGARQAEGDRRAPGEGGRLPCACWGKRKEARKYAGSVRVIPVESFRQALRALATLPPKR